MKTQSTGQCRRHIEYIFDVDDTERMVVCFEEDYKGGFRCYIRVGEYHKRKEDFDVPFGCQPDFAIAGEAASVWLKFHKLTPKGIVDL